MLVALRITLTYANAEHNFLIDPPKELTPTTVVQYADASSVHRYLAKTAA